MSRGGAEREREREREREGEREDPKQALAPSASMQNPRWGLDPPTMRS